MYGCVGVLLYHVCMAVSCMAVSYIKTVLSYEMGFGGAALEVV